MVLIFWMVCTEVIRDRTNFSGYLGRALGKICLKKSLRPLIFSERKSSPPPLFFQKKCLRPPDFFRKKNSSLSYLPKPAIGYEKQFMYVLYVPYANEHTRVTWPNIAYILTSEMHLFWKMKFWFFKILEKKSLRPPYFSEKNVFAPLIFFEKKSAPPYFFR